MWDALGTIAEYRGRNGLKYRLQAMLSITVAATLAGANDLKAIFGWGRRLKPEAMVQFGSIKRRATRNGPICSARSTPMRLAPRSAHPR